MKNNSKKTNSMKRPFGGIVLDSSFRIIIPFTLVYGIYILTHGEYSPGGGFQAGAFDHGGLAHQRQADLCP